MKISISYPPLSSTKGNPFLAQNRQFQWTNTGNVILPVVPAYGATKLQQMGHNVFWDDAIAQRITYSQWLDRLKKFQPDLIFIESKTPTIKRHWLIISEIKAIFTKTKKWRPTIALMGDHVTALPQESLENSPVDYVLTGGDYDFMMVNLTNHLSASTKLEPGFWYRHRRKIVNTGKFALKHHQLDDMPPIDRQLTQWQLYGHHNTNFKFHPGAYLMTGRDCWWGKCTFCSWTTTHPGNTFRTFSVQHTVDEIESMVKLGIREIFDDAGTLPIGKWLNDFCNEMIRRGLHKKVVFGCNMRFAALNQDQYDLMGRAGFRFILYGLESNNQNTLDRIAKNCKNTDARDTLIMAKKAGLEPHLTIMIGYPWESLEDAVGTLNEARQLFKDGLADSMQATIVIPYPGTPLFKECQDNNWLTSTDWDDYDMRQPVMTSPIPPQLQLRLVNQLFKGVLTPKFLVRKVLSIRNIDDITHLINYASKYLKKLKDFPQHQ